MTRINLVPPRELTDQHLVAEYREIFMVGSSLQRSIASKSWSKTLANLPEVFTLNSGHVKFFYNKGFYLYTRYHQLVNEMKQRGMTPDPSRRFKVEQWPDELWNDWSPKTRDLELIRERIQERIDAKPEWYRRTKKNNATLAQLEEQLTCNEQVVGSSPTGGSNLCGTIE
jgi:deoxyribonuclease (pyrimidine dimer)